MLHYMYYNHIQIRLHTLFCINSPIGNIMLLVGTSNILVNLGNTVRTDQGLLVVIGPPFFLQDQSKTVALEWSN